jgi:hypothetical protein
MPAGTLPRALKFIASTPRIVHRLIFMWSRMRTVTDYSDRSQVPSVVFCYRIASIGPAPPHSSPVVSAFEPHRCGCDTFNLRISWRHSSVFPPRLLYLPMATSPTRVAR